MKHGHAGVRAVVFDWAGTTIDYGCQAPLRAFMGLPKRDPRPGYSILRTRSSGWRRNALYTALKRSGFVIYPGKVSCADTFRIGSIGDVHAGDMRRLAEAVAARA